MQSAKKNLVQGAKWIKKKKIEYNVPIPVKLSVQMYQY